MSADSNTLLLRTIFDSLPSMVFVVNEDVEIQEYNSAAAALLATDRDSILAKRAGEVLHCLHSSEAPEGCGRAPSCKECVVRNCVGEAYKGNRIIRARTRLELIRGESKVEIYALITASPFTFNERQLALLVIEDISEIAELQRIIPICSICRKVRDDQESWMRVESYFKSKWDLDFSHSFCPDCYKKELAKLEDAKKGMKRKD